MSEFIFTPLTLAFIVPCYNEEDALPETASKLLITLKELNDKGKVTAQSKIYFIDDGSIDSTWTLISNLSKNHIEICGIKLSRNFGHQNALLCGMLSVDADFVITLDADLQDDISVISEMIDLFYLKNEIVFAVRETRLTDSFFKRLSAELFYRLMLSMKVDLIYNHADYRLMGRKAINALSNYREVNLFLRGIVRLIGFNSIIVKYTRLRRQSGESKYPLTKMISFAWQGITSFSVFPLRIITYSGLTVSLISFILLLWALLIKIMFHSALPGWSSLIVSVYFLGGIQLLSLGIIGEYLGKIYLETKARPNYHIDKVSGDVSIHRTTIINNT